MDRTKIFPTILIFLDIAAAVMSGTAGDWKKSVYWLAAAVLSVTVTF